jgi:parallel beta-helix repeat protein
MKRNLSLQALACLLLCGIFLPSAWASSTVVVGTCMNGTHFTTIQDAINHSAVNGIIDICPGTYPEQLSINFNLTLNAVASSGQNDVVITSPAGGLVANATDLFDGSPIAAQIFVQNAANVTVAHLTVDGSNNNLNGCGTDLVGIYYQNSSGIIGYVATRNQELSADLGGCQVGLGIFVESGYNTSGTSKVTIAYNSVHDYQKNGITADGVGTKATILGNYVVGQGSTPVIAQNGIQVSDGALGSISNNDVADDVYSPGTAGAAGILIYDSGHLSITGNTVNNTQFGIVIYSDGLIDADTNTVTGNKITATHLDDGIDACSNNNTIKTNTVYASDAAGIHIDSTCTEDSAPTGNNTVVTGNTIVEACAGVLTGNGSGNTFSPNTSFNVIDNTFAGDSCPVNGGGVRHRIQHHPSPMKGKRTS